MGRIIRGKSNVTDSKPRGNTENSIYCGSLGGISGSASPGEV